MGNGATMDYGFGSKGNWRRWAWNQAKNRIKARGTQLKDSSCLYLPSQKDLDRKIAKQKGFNDCNLLAVEKNKKVVKILRKKGVNTIHGDFTDVLISWNGSTKIDSIMADFCFGYATPAVEFALFLFGSHGLRDDGTTIVVNLMRGRDRGTVMEKGHMDAFFENYKHNGANYKHRGVQWFWSFLCRCIMSDIYLQILHFEFSDPAPTSLEDIIDLESIFQERRHLAFRLSEDCSPHFFSYKSTTGQYFDSVAFDLKNREHLIDSGFFGDPMGLAFCVKGPGGRWSLAVGDRVFPVYGTRIARDQRIETDQSYRKAQNELDRMDRKIAAAKAIRTMRAQR